MNKQPKCPYKYKNCNKCTHKIGGIRRNNHRVCIFKNPLKCPMYCEWLEDWSQSEEKSLRDVKNEN